MDNSLLQKDFKKIAELLNKTSFEQIEILQKNLTNEKEESAKLTDSILGLTNSLQKFNNEKEKLKSDKKDSQNMISAKVKEHEKEIELRKYYKLGSSKH